MQKRSGIDALKEKARSGPTAATIIIDHANVDENVNIDVNVNIEKPKRKPKFEELYTRATFYIGNELLEKLNTVAEGEKGRKTDIVNEALNAYLRKLERR